MRIKKLKITHWILLGSIVLLLLSASTLVLPTKAASGTYLHSTERVSVASGGGQSDAASFFSFTSQDGRYVTFGSDATNLGPDDAQHTDTFVHDRVTGQTRKLSYDYSGGQTDHDSDDPIISADGRYISYISYATNLVPNDNNADIWQREGLDVFVYDQHTGATQRVSLTIDGNEIAGDSSGTITPNGQYALFFSNGAGLTSNAVFRRTIATGEMVQLTHNIFNGGGGDAGIVHAWGDYDASHVVYSTGSSNLVANDYNQQIDIFLYVQNGNETRRISMGYAGDGANAGSGQPFISTDGRFIVYRSAASNLVPNDTNGEKDIFLYDVETRQTTRINVSSNGQQANGTSRDPSVCANGRYISYTSNANYLVPDDNNGRFDVFLYDTETRETTLVSRTDSGAIANERSHRSFLVPDCSGIVFASDATNLVANDTNNSRDMFMRQIATPPDFSRTWMSCGAAVSPGDTVQHSIKFFNDGTDAGAASFVSPIPADATVITNSLSAGLTYNDIAQQIEWNGTVNGESEIMLEYSLQIDGGLVGPTAVSSTATWSATGTPSATVFCAAIVDGLPIYLPIIHR